MTISKFAALAGAALLAAGTLSAFAAAPGPVAPAAAPPTSIIVFDKPNFKGQSMTFDRSVASLAALQFNDRPASVQIKGRDWVLCEHRNFMGKCVRIRAKERDLKRVKIAGQVSSMYPVPVPPPKQPRQR
jgi:hypothetical protein